MGNESDNLKKLPDETLEVVSGGVDLSHYTKEDLAGIFEYYFNAFGPKTDALAEKLATFGATADDIRESQRIAVRNGSTSFWPWYLADILLERYA